MFYLVYFVLAFASICSCRNYNDFRKTLNISDIGENVTHEIYEDGNDFIIKHLLYPHKNITLINIIDGEHKIWSASKYSENCTSVVLHEVADVKSLLHLRIATESSPYFKYYEYVDRNWKEIDSNKYNAKLYKLKSEREIDISNISDISFCRAVVNSFGNTITKCDVPLDTNVISVSEGKSLLWNRPSEDFKCTRIVLRTKKDDHHRLLMLKVSTHESSYNLYLEYAGDLRNELDECDYKERVKIIEGECSLNIAANNNNNKSFFVEFYRPYGSPGLIYTPKKSTLLRSVMDNDDIIWNYANPDEVCTFVHVHFQHTLPKYARLHITNGMGGHDLYFKKPDTRWVKVGKLDFYNNLHRLDIESQD